MGSFSRFERAIARSLAKKPKLKRVVKYWYSRLIFIFYKKPKNFQCRNSSRLFNFGENSFFGYYDKSPINRKGQILCHIATSDTRLPPRPDKPVLISLFEGAGERPVPIFTCTSSAYNWQQGARLMWLDDDLFIFNDYNPIKKIYFSKIFSASKRTQIDSFDAPVQDAFKDQFLLSLNYQRLMALTPDYGYRNLPPLTRTELENQNDGIWRIDLQNRKKTLLISLKSVKSCAPQAEFAKAFHQLNHVMLSPDGSKFLFIHRYFLDHRRFDRLIVGDSQTGEMSLLSDYGMVSHYCWLTPNLILSYLRGPNLTDGYWLIDVQTKTFSNPIGISGLSDGHPNSHGDWFVTDTYPNKAQLQKLFLSNWRTGQIIELGDFFHGFKFRDETRCDLHPRFALDGQSVFFDSVCDGHRRLYQLPI